MLAFFSGIGTVELLVILGVALIVLGPDKLPGIAKSLGKGLRDLRRASDDIKRTVYTEVGDVHESIQEARKAALGEVKELADGLVEEEDDAESSPKDELPAAQDQEPESASDSPDDSPNDSPVDSDKKDEG